MACGQITCDDCTCPCGRFQPISRAVGTRETGGPSIRAFAWLCLIFGFVVTYLGWIALLYSQTSTQSLLSVALLSIGVVSLAWAPYLFRIS